MALGIKIDKYDKTFAEYIKLRDRGRCQKCGRAHGKLETSHIFSRRHKGVRCDPGNAKLLCFPCHRWWHENPPEAVEWLISIIGEDSYNRLRLRAHRPTKLSVFEKDLIRRDQQEQIKLVRSGKLELDPFNRIYC